MKLPPLCLAAALLASTTYAEEKKDPKPATKPAATQPAQKPAAPFTPPSKPAQTNPAPVRPNPAPTTTAPNALNRLRSNPYEVNTAPRTAPFVGAAPGGAKRDLDRITKIGGTTAVFDGGRGSTLNTGVKPNPVQVSSSSSTYRPALQPASVSQPRQPRVTPPSPTTSKASTSSSSSPSLKDRLKNLLR